MSYFSPRIQASNGHEQWLFDRAESQSLPWLLSTAINLKCIRYPTRRQVDFLYYKILPCERQPASEVKYGQIETNPTVAARVDQRSTANVTSLKGKSANSDLCNIRCSHSFRLARAWQQLWNSAGLSQRYVPKETALSVQESINTIFILVSYLYFCYWKIPTAYAVICENNKYHCSHD